DRPWIKCIPNRPEHFMDVSHGTGPAPPRSEPGNAMVLVNHQVKPWLRLVPPPGCEDCRPFPSPAHNPHSLQGFLLRRPRKVVRKPVNLVSPPSERTQIPQRDPLGPTCEGIARIAPVQHQKSH